MNKINYYHSEFNVSFSFPDSCYFFIQNFLLLYTQNMLLDSLCKLIIFNSFELFNNFFPIVNNIQVCVCFDSLFHYLSIR